MDKHHRVNPHDHIGIDDGVKRGVKVSRKIGGVGPFVLAFLLSFAWPNGGGAGEPVPYIPDSRPDKDEIVDICDAENTQGVYAHAWGEQKILIFGRVYKDGKHDPPDAVVTWTGADGNGRKLWYRGIQVPDADKWLSETVLCEATAK